MVDQGNVRGIIQTAIRRQKARFGENIFSVLMTDFGEQNLMIFFVYRVVARAVLLGLAHQLLHQLIDFQVNIDITFSLPGNNQRGARFVDQDRVHLVHDGEVQLALKAFTHMCRHIVAQVIKAEFVVGAVSDV